MLLFYGCLPHLLLVAIAPYVDPTYNTGWFGHAHGVKPGRSSLLASALSAVHTTIKGLLLCCPFFDGHGRTW